jgi:hypothetical protein
MRSSRSTCAALLLVDIVSCGGGDDAPTKLRVPQRSATNDAVRMHGCVGRCKHYSDVERMLEHSPNSRFVRGADYRRTLSEGTCVYLWPIAGPQHCYGGWRGDELRAIQRRRGDAITAKRPGPCQTSQDQVRHAVLEYHGAVGQISRRRRQDMQTLAAARKAFRMQHHVDVARFGHRHLSVNRKSPLECQSRRSSAKEARSMSGGQAGRFVQEEQFCPTAGCHDGATDTAPVKSAYQPRPTGPAAFE